MHGIPQEAGNMRKSATLNGGLIGFSRPETFLGNLDAVVAANIIASASDIAFIIDGDGIIRDCSLNSPEFIEEGYDNWLGKPWQDTVRSDSKQKIKELLTEAASKSQPRWRQVNHPSSHGADIPVRYSALQIGDEGQVVALGRDMRQLATLQQRLIRAQQTMEQEYARLRNAETRYRLLFQMGGEAILIINAESGKVVEVNPAAARLVGRPGERIIGSAFRQLFDSESGQTIDTLFSALRATGQAEAVTTRLADARREFTLSASIFRQERATLFLVRLTNTGVELQGERASSDVANLLNVVERAPEGFVVTDMNGRILTANTSFLEMAQIAILEQARGQSLDRWIGRPGVEFHTLVRNLKEHGSLRMFETMLRGEYGSTIDIEMSAVAVDAGEVPCLGFVIRDISGRPAAASTSQAVMPRSIDKLTKLVGRVPLKDLVRESTDMIERLCIEAALQLTNDNRASAAELLGLSRQSLYAKLHRYGLLDNHSASDK
jgi:transcriptional regulator PpsR